MRWIVIASISAALSCIAHTAHATAVNKMFPPAPLYCKEAPCNQKPEDFEDYAADFYRWYLHSDVMYFRVPAGKDRQLESERNAYLQTILHAKLRHWQRNQEEETDIPHCTADTDIITCSQDIYNSWESTLSSQYLGGDSHKAIVLIRLPSPPDENNNPVIPHLLCVTMVLNQGVWQIYGVEDLVSE